MNFSSIWKSSFLVQDIWKDGEFSQRLLSSLDQKSFNEVLFKGVKSPKRSGKVDCQQVRSIDRNLFFFQTKATHFETVMATVDEVNSDKIKVPKEYIFCSVLLDCFTAKLDA